VGRDAGEPRHVHQLPDTSRHTTPRPLVAFGCAFSEILKSACPDRRNIEMGGDGLAAFHALGFAQACGSP
jgi:hypothetical protein